MTGRSVKAILVYYGIELAEASDLEEIREESPSWGFGKNTYNARDRAEYKKTLAAFW